MRVLVVEDSIRLADALADVLGKEHFMVDIAHDGKRGYECATTGIYDIVLLDVALSLMSGYEVLRRLRENRIETPVILLSERAATEDKLEGFRLGADDYMTKPFDVRELIMRIIVIVKRGAGREPVYLEMGNLRLDTGTCELLNMDSLNKMRIAGKEMQLLEFLIRNRGQVIEKEQIATKIWGFESDAEYNKVEVYVSFLRRRFNHLNVNARIRAVRGVGYILEVRDDNIHACIN